ncbi:MAG: hypothetical protein ACLTOP_05290 [Collinsella phocaeensis]
MSQNRKMLKIFSLIQVPIALAALVMGALTLAGSSAAGGNASVLGIELAASLWQTILGAAAIAGGVLALVSASFGIRGANRPSSLGSHLPVSVLSAVAGVLAALGCTAGLNAGVAGAALAICAILACVYDRKVVKELDR